MAADNNGLDLTFDSLNHILSLANELVSEAKALQDVRQASPVWFTHYDTWGCLSSPDILNSTAAQFLESVESLFSRFEAEIANTPYDQRRTASKACCDALLVGRSVVSSSRAFADLFQSEFLERVQNPSGLVSDQVGFQLNSLFFSIKSGINSFVSLVETIPRAQQQATKQTSSSSSGRASQLPPPPLPARQPTTRLHLLNELLETEETYNRGLRLFSKYYLLSLTKKIVKPRPLVDRQTLKTFTDAQEMVSVITQVLLTDMRSEFERNPKDAHVGAVFRRLLPLFRLYSQYINRFSALQTGLQVLKEIPEFKEWMAKREAKMQAQENATLTIDSCLILPVQRIFRYEMLFQNLTKETAPMHPDFLALQEVAENMRFINNAINEETRSLESIEYITTLQKEVANLPPIFKLSMIFLRSTTMEARFHRDTFAKTLDLIMFNSMLLLSSRTVRSQTFVDSLAFNEVELKELDDQPLSFELINRLTRKKWRFWAQNQEHFDSWVGALGQAIQTNTFRERFEQLQTTPPTIVDRIVAPEGQRLLVASFQDCKTEAHWTKMWDNRETGMPTNVSIYRPLPPPGFYIIGDYVESFQKFEPLPKQPENVWAVREDPSRLVPLRPLLVPPTDWKLVWTDKGTGSDFGDVSVWVPIAPPGYIGLGAVTSIHYSPYRPPDAEAIRFRCVHESVLQKSAYHSRPLIGTGGRRRTEPGPVWAYSPKLFKALSTSAVSLWTVSSSSETECSRAPGTFFPSTKKGAPDGNAVYCFRPFERREAQ